MMTNKRAPSLSPPPGTAPAPGSAPGSEPGSALAPPLVSVLMPVYNLERFLDEAVRSIRAQTFTAWELIAIDDGSTDRSLAILQQHAAEDPRIRVLSRANTGIVGALQDGLAVARGLLIARMDGDDFSVPQRFALQVEYLQSHPECIAVGCRLEFMDTAGNRLRESRHLPTHAEIAAQMLALEGDGITHATTIIRRAALDQAGGYRAEYDTAEDYDLFLRLLEVGETANLPQVLYRYRQHFSSTLYTRFDKHVQARKRALIDMERRRGITLDWEKLNRRLNALHPPTPASALRNWSMTCLKQGQTQLARQHALGALCRSPWSIESWRVMYWALCA
ncbi:MAG: glycosyltransferase [Phycisphaeraceae bacterium]|nr:glycosyltransferase [Phycisphaeraceae bacterium]